MEKLKMNNPDSSSKMIDYIYILYKWRKILFINLLTVTILTTVISFIIPTTYKATSTVILPSSNPISLGGLGNLLSDRSSALEIGTKIFGITSTNEDLILGLLMSRTILSDVIDKYNLMDYYEIDENNYDKAIKAFMGDLIFEPNEYGMIEVSVINKDPKVSASMVKYFIRKADSLNIRLNITQAKNNRELIENRYKENLRDLELAENNFKEFQKKYGAFALPEQIKVAAQAIGELEIQLMQQNILLNSVAENFDENSSLFKSIQNNINAIKSEIRNLERKKEFSSNGLILRLDNLPEMQIEYIRKYRDLEIQNKILEFLYPLYEQAKLDEQRSIPTMLVVDEAVPPQLKYAPKRAFIILFVLFFFFFAHLPIIFHGEYLINTEELRNPLQEKIKHLYIKILRLYKVKFNSN